MVQGLSINTNVGAMVALEQLNLTNKKLQNTQLRITTGLKVNGPKDDAATFQIATRLRGDIAGTKAVGGALAQGDESLQIGIRTGVHDTVQNRPTL